MTETLATTIRALEERLWQAQRESDVAVLDELLADDALFTGMDGSRMTKENDLEMHRTGAMNISRLDPLEFAVREIPGGAVASIKMAGAATIHGKEAIATLCYMRVWIQRAGRWQVVAAQMFAVPGSV